MPRTTGFKNMVSKAVKKSGSSSKELTTKVKTQVKAMLKKSSPSSHVKKDINVHVRRITDKMDVDVVVHQVQDEDVKKASHALGSNSLARLPPVHVLLQDREGDIRMKNPELSDYELVSEVKNITHDIFSLDMNIVQLFGSLHDSSNLVPRDTSVTLLPPGLVSRGVCQSVNGVDIGDRSPVLGSSHCPTPLDVVLPALTIASPVSVSVPPVFVPAPLVSAPSPPIYAPSPPVFAPSPPVFAPAPPVSAPAPPVFDVDMLDASAQSAPPVIRQTTALEAKRTSLRIFQDRSSNRFRPYSVISRCNEGVRVSKRPDVWKALLQEVKRETGLPSAVPVVAPVQPSVPAVETLVINNAPAAPLVETVASVQIQEASVTFTSPGDLTFASSNGSEDADELSDYEDDDEAPVATHIAKQEQPVDDYSDVPAGEGEGPAPSRLVIEDKVDALIEAVKDDVDDWQFLVSGLEGEGDDELEDYEGEDEDEDEYESPTLDVLNNYNYRLPIRRPSTPGVPSLKYEQLSTTICSKTRFLFDSISISQYGLEPVFRLISFISLLVPLRLGLAHNSVSLWAFLLLGFVSTLYLLDLWIHLASSLYLLPPGIPRLHIIISTSHHYLDFTSLSRLHIIISTSHHYLDFDTPLLSASTHTYSRHRHITTLGIGFRLYSILFSTCGFASPLVSVSSLLDSSTTSLPRLHITIDFDITIPTSHHYLVFDTNLLSASTHHYSRHQVSSLLYLFSTCGSASPLVSVSGLSSSHDYLNISIPHSTPYITIRTPPCGSS
ncbi:hypothetical protein BC629DRAFT_1589889 [Irpex lacteus]|nr:hypothetical protein BC629DRAFT_1589889 [Irpex lacteus]